MIMSVKTAKQNDMSIPTGPVFLNLVSLYQLTTLKSRPNHVAIYLLFVNWWCLEKDMKFISSQKQEETA